MSFLGRLVERALIGAHVDKVASFQQVIPQGRGRSRPTAVLFWFVVRASLSWLGALK